jgi:hypothetical protein
MANPGVNDEDRARLQRELMAARSALGRARRAGDAKAHQKAREQIDKAKVALGERGPPWWDDDAPDYNRRMAVNTPYRAWFEAL